MQRVVGALGLQQMGQDLCHDPDLVVCRAEQLSKLEGDKLVDKVVIII